MSQNTSAKMESINASLAEAESLSDRISSSVNSVLHLRDQVEAFHAKLETYFRFRKKVTEDIRKNYEVFKAIVKDLYQVGALSKRRFQDPIDSVNITLLFNSFNLIADKVEEYHEKVNSVMMVLDHLISEIDLQETEDDPLGKVYKECIQDHEIQETQNMIVDFKISIQFVIKTSYQKIADEVERLEKEYQECTAKLEALHSKFTTLTKQKEFAASFD
eukprot:TRINITY_DN12816_c0_g1_i6.p1 TRINITY_DN12816_c0_g1~~TRINITY_DN12816_c0_g1_i6.p1  ORF type:complete len:218 (+),score=40.50 TRINITY_DN12816_c0_g1_i6:63-716(+)